MRVENQIKTRVWEDLSLCPETSTKNVIQSQDIFSECLVLTNYSNSFTRRKTEEGTQESQESRQMFQVKYN